MLRRSLFSLDGWDQAYVGWTDGSTWNGWAAPMFDFDTALAIARDYRPTDDTQPHRAAAWYEPRSDSFVFLANFEEPFEAVADRFAGEDWLMGVGSTRRLYPVGRQAWCWVERRDLLPDTIRIGPVASEAQDPDADKIVIRPAASPPRPAVTGRRPLDLVEYARERGWDPPDEGRDGR